MLRNIIFSALTIVMHDDEQYIMICEVHYTT